MLNKILPKGSKRREIVKKVFLEPKVPAHLSKNFREINKTGLDIIKSSLEQNYFAAFPKGYLETDCGRNDVVDHLFRRLQIARSFVIPWIDHAKPPQNINILEIGCGTGCSTVSLAEQGARVIAIDESENALIVDRKRCRIYGVEVSAINIERDVFLYENESFDVVIMNQILVHTKEVFSIFCPRRDSFSKLWGKQFYPFPPY